MATINLYRIDSEKKHLCLRDLSNSSLELKNTISKTVISNDLEYDFAVTLYLESPYQSDEEISWNWILSEYNEPLFQAFRAPKAVLLIEETVNETEQTYAITFGSSFFRIDKFCDRDFGFNFATRMEYTDIKTTTLTAPNLKRSKTVNTYINYNDLDFNSGESFSKLKVNAKVEEGFNLFKPSLEIGNSIRFNIENESIDTVLEVILYVEDILKIPPEEVKYKIPLFQLVKDNSLLELLNQSINQLLINTLVNGEEIALFTIPELQIVGASEVFNHTDDEFELRYLNSEPKKITHLTESTIKTFCEEKNINSIDKIDKIKVVRCQNGDPVAIQKLKDIIEYTNDEHKCIFHGNKWYMFNRDYLTYLNESIKEVDTFYYESYNFLNVEHDEFLDQQYILEKDNAEYIGKSSESIKSSLKRKYYAERWYNIKREADGGFTNHDREGTSAGFEKMDLYEIESKTMFAVKKGKASSDLCYAVDQSLTALKKLKHGEIADMPPISNVGLWFILERRRHLPIDENNKVDLTALDMLMLKNRIDQWKKEVRLAGYKPIIYINYKL